jgi:hypothetical protein
MLATSVFTEIGMLVSLGIVVAVIYFAFLKDDDSN